MKPPTDALSAMARLASCSPCSKSKRGVIVYDPSPYRLWGSGFNTPPKPMFCTGTDECRRDCGKICIHAEQMAISAALEHRTRAGAKKWVALSDTRDHWLVTCRDCQLRLPQLITGLQLIGVKRPT